MTEVKKFFAIRETGTLEVIGFVDEKLKDAIVHLLGDHILVDEVNPSVSMGTHKEGGDGYSYIGLQPVGTYKMNDQFEMITRKY